MSNEIILEYRNWQLTVTDTSATAINDEGERFECHCQPSAEEALRTVKNKVEWLEGPEAWNMEYTDGALR